MKGTTKARYSTDVLAGRTRNRNAKGGNGGTRFLQRKVAENKDLARRSLLKFFTRKAYPQRLSILTFPSVRWIFERELLQLREKRTVFDKGRVWRTFITAIEREEEIYRSAFKDMPGIDRGIQFVDSPPFATSASRTKLIRRFFRCDFEALAFQGEDSYSAAWLDFNGPLNLSRMEAVKEFWDSRIRDILVLSFMHGRYDTKSAEVIKLVGGIENYVTNALRGATVKEWTAYRDTVSMHQVVLSK